MSVAWRSVSFAVDLTQRSTLPVPTIGVSAVSGSLRYDTAVPSGSGSHVYGGCAVHAASTDSPGRLVSGRLLGSGS